MAGFQDIANAIRSKENSSLPIVANDFAQRILDLPSGSVEYKSVLFKVNLPKTIQNMNIPFDYLTTSTASSSATTRYSTTMQKNVSFKNTVVFKFPVVFSYNNEFKIIKNITDLLIELNQTTFTGSYGLYMPTNVNSQGYKAQNLSINYTQDNGMLVYNMTINDDNFPYTFLYNATISPVLILPWIIYPYGGTLPASFSHISGLTANGQNSSSELFYCMGTTQTTLTQATALNSLEFPCNTSSEELNKANSGFYNSPTIPFVITFSSNASSVSIGYRLFLSSLSGLYKFNNKYDIEGDD